MRDAALLEALLAVRAVALAGEPYPAWFSPKWGICDNLWEAGWEHGIPAELMESWPHFSGNRGFPVPGGADAYWTTLDLWTGKYGALRMDLLKHMIRELGGANA